MSIEPPPSPPAVAFHAIDAAEAFRLAASGPNGISTEAARERLAMHGPNRLSERPGRTALERFLLQFHNVLIYVLLGAALVTALLGQWVDTGVIVGVVVINALVGFIQEGKAEQALESIRAMLSLKALAIRDGQLVSVPSAELVPGDVVQVQSGDRVPADLRLVRVKTLRIDEASLTGESVPVEKQSERVGHDTALGDRTSMAYSGTLVTFGQGRGVVVATGDRTEIGRISELLAGVERLETPLLRKIAVFARWLSLAILVLAALTFFLGIARGYPASVMFLAAVGLAVAAIPEGLPAVMTITLAIGVQRMARRNAIVRLLPAVEGLGSVTVVCSDKTGTLTRNEMMVQSAVTADREYSVSGSGYEPRGDFLADGARADPAGEPGLLDLVRAGMLCNDACVHQRDGEWSVDGDPTEGALLVVAMKAGFDAARESARSPRTDLIPFESEHRFMATLHQELGGHAFVYLKGAPERVLELCSHERHAGEDRPLQGAVWEHRIDALGGQGQRVLAVAFKRVGPELRELGFADVEGGLTLLGLLGMIDPPRAEAISAVAACRSAGIRVKMITGDHRATAAAIAAALGIGAGRAAMTGAELERADDATLRRIAPETDVYARVSPEHKLRLVEALQANGEVVAMTGDGVNDAPALKRADIGVAMGITGTEAAKEAAEMVLADDNFASIANAVEEGRTVYDNLRKTILFMMPTNGAEAGALMAAIALGLTLPILPVQILWVNMITAVTLSLALAFEPSEPGVMRRPPRDPRAPIFSRYFLWRTILVTVVATVVTLGMFILEEARGASVEAARTAAVNTLVMLEAFYLLSARFLLEPAWPSSFVSGNRFVPLTFAAAIGLQMLFTYAPFMQTLFHSAPIGPEVWLRIVLVSLSLYIVVELEKWIVRAIGWRVV